MDVQIFSIAQARQELDNGNVSALELTRACLRNIEALDGDLQACLSVDNEGALAAAEKADKRLSQGESSPLLGIPY